MIESCPCCGGQSLTYQSILWPELVAAWRLDPEEAAYVNQQQGFHCAACGNNLRAMVLARAVLACCRAAGTLAEFVRTPAAATLRVLEVNEAGRLTPILSALPHHRLVRYPDVDMQVLPFAGETFDMVIHSDTLEHVEHPIRALAECRRVLAPGGYCIFTVPTIVGRLTASRAGLTESYHGSEAHPEFLVRTEYGADAWTHVMRAGFEECRLFALAFPSAIAYVGVRG